MYIYVFIYVYKYIYTYIYIYAHLTIPQSDVCLQNGIKMKSHHQIISSNYIIKSQDHLRECFPIVC